MNAATSSITVEPNVPQALWARFVAPVLDGMDSQVRGIRLPPDTDLERLFPLGSIITDMRSVGGHVVLAAEGGWTAIASKWDGRDADVWLRANDIEIIEKAVAALRANAPAPTVDETSVTMDFWQAGQRMYTTTRPIAAPAWAEVRDHYPAPVRDQIEALIATELTTPVGRIVLWYGPPGTGKTTAIRSLAREWRTRARFQVVLDPDALFSASAALMTVLMDEPDDDEPAWRVLVIEDADELLRADAKERVGQALSRLLNLGDGIVGQGMNVLTLITTNEPIEALHPALARPGRCLAQTNFRLFTRAEAKAWRGDAIPDGEHLSLAEILVGRAPNTDTRPLPGMYL